MEYNRKEFNEVDSKCLYKCNDIFSRIKFERFLSQIL